MRRALLLIGLVSCFAIAGIDSSTARASDLTPPRSASGTLQANGRVWPVEDHRVHDGCAFRGRRCALTGSEHTGVDFSGHEGPVYSASSGTIYLIVRNGEPEGGVCNPDNRPSHCRDHGLGNTVVVKESDSLYWVYAHLADDSIPSYLYEGRPVAAGEELGRIGGTGYGLPSHWKTPHLHLEVRSSAPSRDPALGDPSCPGVFGYRAGWHLIGCGFVDPLALLSGAGEPDAGSGTSNRVPSLVGYLSQWAGNSGLAAGATAEPGWFTFRVFGWDSDGDSIRAEVEVRDVNEGFTGSATAAGVYRTDGQTTVLTYLDPGDWKWRGRVVDARGASSPWVDAGFTEQNLADLIVRAAGPSPQPSPSSGNSGSPPSSPGSPPSGSSGSIAPSYQPDVTYWVHIANLGDRSWTASGNTAGDLTNQLEEITVSVSGLPPGARLRYRVHVAYDAWHGWVDAGNAAGTRGQSKGIEAIKMEILGTNDFTVEYRVRPRGKGWTSWKGDGAEAGTTGEGRPIVGIQIRVVEN
jgi:hypothetical protein